MKKKVVVIGAGFGGLSAAGYLAKEGYEVTILEKNNWVGGRAQVYSQAGFRFDMGPSWYLLWEEHEKWFVDMGVKRSDYYDIKKLSPQYSVYFDTEKYYVISDEYSKVKHVFESIEPGSSERLDKYLAECRKKFDISMEHFIYDNFNSWLSMMKPHIVGNAFHVDLLKTYRAIVRRYFSHPYLIALLEYPTVFLGASARSLPAVYTLMNWVDFGQGAYYPDGGFGKVVESMAKVVKQLGVRIELGAEANDFVWDGRLIRGVQYVSHGKQKTIEATIVVANADYNFVEQRLLPYSKRSFSHNYWERRKLAPSTLNFYIALDTDVKGMEHHTFFFDANWERNFDDVYIHRTYSKKPLFYVHVASKTDPYVAPQGSSTLFVLIPLAPGLDDTEETRNYYFDHVIRRMEHLTKQKLRKHILFYKSYSIRDYEFDYNAYKGNAFGLGQTLFQTAAFRPPNRSKKVPNLYFAGQYSIPGTGTSMAMIGGKVVSKRIIRENTL